jgi:hypothetical protein
MTKPESRNVVLHIRVTPKMHEQIEARAHREQRNASDMARVLMQYALHSMPRSEIPNGSLLKETS